MKKKEEVIDFLESRKNTKNIEGMKRFGINPEKGYGVATPDLKYIAKIIGRDHQLARELWDTGIHEARIIAALIDDPKSVTPQQMDRWAEDFNSWDVCDQCCLKLFRYTDHVDNKIREWAVSDREFVKRAAFSLIATYASGNKSAPDEVFIDYFNLIFDASVDERNFVKKSVNWALRQIGKRNYNLYTRALLVSEELMFSKSKSARWIGSDATRELTTDKVIRRLKIE